MFAHIIEVLFAAVMLVIVYQVFLSDYITEKRDQNRGSREKYDSTAKIAQVKLVSDDAKDIETFITNNARYLSGEMVTKLVDRIEAIRTDQVINADTILKKRIDDLAPQEEEPAVVKRASKKR
jgi:hypothetical protein